MSYWKNTSTIFTDGPALDAFGALRVTEPHQIFESKLLFNDRPDIWSRIGGGASQKYSFSQSLSTYQVTASGDFYISQTKQSFAYVAGVGIKILSTFVLGAPVPNTIARVGYFNGTRAPSYTSSYDGLYLERSGSFINLCIATAATGYGTASGVLPYSEGFVSKVSQSAWNLDRMDGTGPSGVNLNFSNTQIMHIDFQWLGVGRVRFGFVNNGILYYVHQVLNTNVTQNIYMQYPNHPIRFELISYGGSSSLSQICSTVINEGSVDFLGQETTVSNNITASLPAMTTLKPTTLLGVRLRSGSFNQTVTPVSVSTTAISSSLTQFYLVLNPSYSGSFAAWGNNGTSSYEYATSYYVTASANGLVLNTWWGTAASPPQTMTIPTNVGFGSSINGTPDELWVLAVGTTTGSALASMTLREV